MQPVRSASFCSRIRRTPSGKRGNAPQPSASQPTGRQPSGCTATRGTVQRWAGDRSHAPVVARATGPRVRSLAKRPTPVRPLAHTCHWSSSEQKDDHRAHDNQPQPTLQRSPGPRTSSISRDHRQTSRPRAPCVGRLGAPVARREQMFARLRTACKANRRAGQQLHKAGHRAHGATGCVCTMVPKNDRWHEASNRSHTATGTQPDRWTCPPVALRASGRRTAGRGERESKGTGRHGT